MKKVCFIGGYKKTDMILYIAKMLTLANKRVLLMLQQNKELNMLFHQ